tara:strand:- start:1833 stop:2354 length:522 start_codon:yes stop_codon:yes gene_type:complete
VKNFKILFFLIIFLNFFSYAYSQTIAYANLDKIIKTSDVGVKIINYFAKKNEDIIKDIKKKEQNIRDKEQSLVSQKNILQEDEYSKKVVLIRKEIEEFNISNKKRSIQLNKEREKVTNSFLIEINKVLRDYAEKNKIDIIISSNQMLIGKSSLDLTNEILKNVNSKIKNFKIE